MSVIYSCKHCGNVVGQLEQRVIDTTMLGWNELNHEERKDMIQYQNDGNVKIKTICEDCQDTLEKNPHYHELDFFIQ